MNVVRMILLIRKALQRHCIQHKNERLQSYYYEQTPMNNGGQTSMTEQNIVLPLSHRSLTHLKYPQPFSFSHLPYPLSARSTTQTAKQHPKRLYQTSNQILTQHKPHLTSPHLHLPNNAHNPTNPLPPNNPRLQHALPPIQAQSQARAHHPIPPPNVRPIRPTPSPKHRHHRWHPNTNRHFNTSLHPPSSHHSRRPCPSARPIKHLPPPATKAKSLLQIPSQNAEHSFRTPSRSQ